jgi:hypothetical protein
MKTVNPWLLSLIVAVGFLFPAASAAWAGEPNTALFENNQPETNAGRSSGSMSPSSRECPPEAAPEKDGQHDGTQNK